MKRAAACCLLLGRLALKGWSWCVGLIGQVKCLPPPKRIWRRQRDAFSKGVRMIQQAVGRLSDSLFGMATQVRLQFITTSCKDYRVAKLSLGSHSGFSPAVGDPGSLIVGWHLCLHLIPAISTSFEVTIIEFLGSRSTALSRFWRLIEGQGPCCQARVTGAAADARLCAT
jgi:hypothetical protein